LKQNLSAIIEAKSFQVSTIHFTVQQNKLRGTNFQSSSKIKNNVLAADCGFGKLLTI